MKKRFVGLLVTATVGSFAATGLAQAGEAIEVEEQTQDDTTVKEETAPAGAGAEGLGDICAIDPSQCPELNAQIEAKRELHETLFAVQQIYALRARRLEVQPYWQFTMNDPFVSHPGGGLAFNYYLTNVLGFGVDINYYFNSENSFAAQQRSATRMTSLETEYRWGASGNFTYVPVYGKFAGFGDFIFNYDIFVIGGAGAISTRPLSIIDPTVRTFEFETKLALNAGLGLRIFFTRWLAAVVQLRDHIFLDQLEAEQPGATPEARLNKSTWLGEESLTNNVQAQLGISIFLPFQVDYKLPK